MRIIPAIDIINGKCVRLTKGDFTTQKIYSENPLEVAKQFENAGIRHLHLVDLDGAKSGSIINQQVLCDIAVNTKLKIDFGGGIKSDSDAAIAFDNGASVITAGSIAVHNPEMALRWISRYGSHRVILGADCRNRKIAINGWQDDIETDVIDFIREHKAKGFSRAICTDIAKDGMMQGPAIALYLEILTSTQIKLVASGGITSIKDLIRLKEIGCEGAIIGKALYEGKIDLKEMVKLLC